MKTKLTEEEFCTLKRLIATQNNLIYRFENYAKQVTEPQLKENFQKFCASIKNHKLELLGVLEVADE